MTHKWKFFKSARCVQVKIENGDDIASLAELDRKLWTVLSASFQGLKFDSATLKFLDGDGDGRIRVPEVLSAIDWLKARFKNLDFLLKRKDEISLSDINEESPDGKILADAFKVVLAGNPDAKNVVSLSEVLGATKVFNAQEFNGDGVVTTKSGNADIINLIIKCEGSVKDLSGEDGIDKAKADAFFAKAAEQAKWAAAEKDAILAINDGLTDSAKAANAYAAFSSVKEKIDEYFMPPEDLPLIAEDPTPVLPLMSGVHPLWAAKFMKFAKDCVSLVFGEAKESVTRGEWLDIKGKMTAYGKWHDAKPAGAIGEIGENVLRELLDGGRAQAEIDALIEKDLSKAGISGQFKDCEKAVRYAANLTNFLCNYVNQANLYDTKNESVFHTGELYIDGRVCKLCFHVANEGSHSALAAKSKCCLLYVKLSRPSAGETREICAVVTAGTTSSLYAGRNGLFYDCDGRDWEAVVSKVVEAQVSLKEAFWAPWAKIATTISEQCKKFLSSKQDAAVAKVGSGANAAASSAAAGNAGGGNAANGAALASGVAALGVGVGMAGAACAGLIGLVAGLPLWKVFAGVGAIILIVSLPSVVLAWFKLRARDLGAILNAGGWAVNRPLHFSIGLARTFTRPAEIPAGAAVASDPYASKWLFKTLLTLLFLVIIAAVTLEILI